MRYAGLLLLMMLLAACTSATQRTLVSQSAAAHSLSLPDQLPKALRVPLRFEKGYLFVDASVDGQRVGAMMLDTGSTINIIDKGVVHRLRLAQVGAGQTRGIAGTEAFTFHALSSLAIGDLDLGAKRAAALSMYKLTRGIQMSPAGLIGSVSLLPQPFTIDYTRRELVVYNRSTFVPPADAERVKLLSYSGLPAVQATLANGRRVLLLIDTGADNAVSLPMEMADQPGILATGASGAGISTGVGGHIQTQSGWLSRLDVFGFTLANVPVTFEQQPISHGPGGLPVGRIGGQLLQGFRLTFDGRYQSLWAQFSAPISDE